MRLQQTSEVDPARIRISQAVWVESSKAMGRPQRRPVARPSVLSRHRGTTKRRRLADRKVQVKLAQVSELDCSSAVRYRQEPAFSLGRNPSPNRYGLWTLRPCSPNLWYNGPHPVFHTTYRTQRHGRLSWPSRLTQSG